METTISNPGPASARDRRKALERLRARLFDRSDAGLWAVLDGARIERLVREIEGQRVPAECLLPGKLDPSMERVAPYLARLDEASPFVDWLLERGWGRSWGIFVRFAGDMTALRRHLRRFLTVRDPGGRSVFFRFYDPRVLRIYLPTCNAAEVAAFFGPVRGFAMESEDGSELLEFTPESAPPKLLRTALVG